MAWYVQELSPLGRWCSKVYRVVKPTEKSLGRTRTFRAKPIEIPDEEARLPIAELELKYGDATLRAEEHAKQLARWATTTVAKMTPEEKEAIRKVLANDEVPTNPGEHQAPQAGADPQV